MDVDHSSGTAGRSIMRSILPTSVTLCEYSPDLAHVDLHPEEARLPAFRRFAPRRRLEFVAGRRCARKALSSYGLDRAPILIAENGAPIWPPGIRGSITHCDGYCAAAVTTSPELLSLGIDAEVWTTFPLEISDHIARPEELADCPAALTDKIQFLTTLFSAKESIYKAINLLEEKFFDYRSVCVSIDRYKKSFYIKESNVDIVNKYKPYLFGSYLKFYDYVMTSVIIMPCSVEM